MRHRIEIERSTRHVLALDGLRGIAAIAVALLHFNEFFFGGGRGPSLPAALSVDFFFMLSGYVLIHAYQERLDAGLGWGHFMLLRLIRLYPMLFVAILVSAVIEFAKATFSHSHGINANLGELLGTLFLLPMGFANAQSIYPFASDGLFLYNPPIWSLFFEFAASAAFATRARNWPLVAWRGLFGLAAISLIAIVLADGMLKHLGGGNLPMFLAGFLRIAVPFLIGVGAYHSDLVRRLPSLPFWAIASALLVTLLWSGPRNEAAYDLVSLFLLFPLVLGLGTRTALSPRTESFANILGRLSYPLYLLHEPVSRIVAFVIKQRFSDPPTLFVLSAIVSVGASWLMLRLYDEPVRKWLGERIRPRSMVNVPA